MPWKWWRPKYYLNVFFIIVLKHRIVKIQLKCLNYNPINNFYFKYNKKQNVIKTQHLLTSILSQVNKSLIISKLDFSTAI